MRSQYEFILKLRADAGRIMILAFINFSSPCCPLQNRFTVIRHRVHELCCLARRCLLASRLAQLTKLLPQICVHLWFDPWTRATFLTANLPYFRNPYSVYLYFRAAVEIMNIFFSFYDSSHTLQASADLIRKVYHGNVLNTQTATNWAAFALAKPYVKCIFHRLWRAWWLLNKIYFTGATSNPSNMFFRVLASMNNHIYVENSRLRIYYRRHCAVRKRCFDQFTMYLIL